MPDSDSGKTVHDKQGEPEVPVAPPAPATTQPPEPIAEIKPTPVLAAPEPKAEEQGNIHGTKDREAPSVRQMVWLTGIIAFATIANVGIFYLESESTGKQIDKLAAKADGIVSAMNTALSNSQDAIKKAFEENKAAVDASNTQNQRSVKATLTAAADTNKIAQQALESQQRPWITESSQIGAPIDFNVNGANITFLFTLDNVGHTPAEKVWVEAKLVNIISAGMPSLEEHKKVCNGPTTTTITPRNFTLGEILFPGKPFPWAWSWTIPWSEIQGARAPNLLGPLLYGCIEYSYGLSTERHSTPFRYAVVQADGRLLVQDGGFNISTKGIPPSMLSLRREGVLGQPSPD